MSCMNVFWCVFSLPPLQQQIITKAQNDHDHPNPKKKNPRKCRAKISNRIQPKMHSIEHNHFYSNLFSLLSAYLPKNTNLSWMQCTTTTSITTKKGGGILRIWVVLRKKTLAATLAPEISTKVSFFQPHHHQSCCIFSCVLPFCLVHQVNLVKGEEREV